MREDPVISGAWIKAALLILVAGTVERLQGLNRCIEAASGDIDKITACFDRFNSGQ